MLCLQGVPDVPREPPDEAGLMRMFQGAERTPDYSIFSSGLVPSLWRGSHELT